MVVRLLYFSNIEMNVHLPIPEESCSLLRIADDTVFNAIIAVPTGLYVEFHWRSDFDIQKVIIDLFQVLCSICLNLLVVNDHQLALKRMMFTSFDLSV